MTERLNLLSYRRNLRRRSTSKSDYTSASGSQCFISMARSIAMARQTVHRAKSEAGYAPAPPFHSISHRDQWKLPADLR